MKNILLSLFLLPVLLYAQPLIPESEFFALPGLEELSDPWLVELSDSTIDGLGYPTDIDVIRLTEYDYRMVIVRGFAPHIITFPIDLVNGVNPQV